VLELLGASIAQYGFGMQGDHLFFVIGVAGICIFILLMHLWLKRFKATLLNQSIPAILLILWGILGAWLISIGRSDMAPWYGAVSMNFWIGLAGTIFILIFDYLDSANANSLFRPKRIYLILPVFAFMAIFAIYAPYNIFSRQYPFISFTCP